MDAHRSQIRCGFSTGVRSADHVFIVTNCNRSVFWYIFCSLQIKKKPFKLLAFEELNTQNWSRHWDYLTWGLVSASLIQPTYMTAAVRWHKGNGSNIKSSVTVTCVQGFITTHPWMVRERKRNNSNIVADMHGTALSRDSTTVHSNCTNTVQSLGAGSWGEGSENASLPTPSPSTPTTVLVARECTRCIGLRFVGSNGRPGALFRGNYLTTTLHPMMDALALCVRLAARIHGCVCVSEWVSGCVCVCVCVCVCERERERERERETKGCISTVRVDTFQIFIQRRSIKLVPYPDIVLIYLVFWYR